MPFKAGMPLLLALIGASPVTGAVPSVERVEIVLVNFSFRPSQIHLRSGQPYLLHFVNQGSGGHNFAAKKFFDAAQISGTVPPGGAIELKKGEASFHHPMMVHGSFANNSDRPRRAAVINVIRDGVMSDSNEPLLEGVPVIPKGKKLDGQFFPLLYDPQADD